MDCSILKFIVILAAVNSLSSIAYYLLCIWSALDYLHSDANAEAVVHNVQKIPPGVSILKPLKGVDAETYENLRSHCLQDYPEYEVVFGVSDRLDSAVEMVGKLRAEFPAVAINLVICEERLGTNVKVSNLAQMAGQARYEFLIVNDSDIRVPPAYLRKVTDPLAESRVGMVTCLYRGIAAKTLGSRLESLGIGTDFAAGVLTARYLENGIHFGLGSTLAFRRADLVAIGGFEAIADHLADDYELGVRIAALGREVQLSSVVVETYLQPYSMGNFVMHQLRWARAIRNSRPRGYVGLLFTFGLPWATLAVLASKGSAVMWSLFGVTGAMRFLMAWTVGDRVLRDRQVRSWLWLLPLRDFVALLIWVASFASPNITWSGDRSTLENGRLIRLKR